MFDCRRSEVQMQLVCFRPCVFRMKSNDSIHNISFLVRPESMLFLSKFQQWNNVSWTNRYAVQLMLEMSFHLQLSNQQKACQTFISTFNLWKSKNHHFWVLYFSAARTSNLIWHICWANTFVGVTRSHLFIIYLFFAEVPKSLGCGLKSTFVVEARFLMKVSAWLLLPIFRHKSCRDFQYSLETKFLINEKSRMTASIQGTGVLEYDEWNILEKIPFNCYLQNYSLF